MIIDIYNVKFNYFFFQALNAVLLFFNVLQIKGFVDLRCI